MNKLKELLDLGWAVTACYSGDKFYLIASDGPDTVRSSSHAVLEMAVIELYVKCMVTDDLPIAP